MYHVGVIFAVIVVMDGGITIVVIIVATVAVWVAVVIVLTMLLADLSTRIAKVIP